MAHVTLTTDNADARSELPQDTQMDRTLLAIDLGTTTGWALRSTDGLITSGTVSFRPSRYDGGGMRYLRFQNWLAEMDRLAGPIATIWYEEVRRHAGTDAAHVFGGLLATLTSWAEFRGIPYGGVPFGTIKKFATGKGNAPKQAMIEAARKRGFSPADDNAAGLVKIDSRHFTNPLLAEQVYLGESLAVRDLEPSDATARPEVEPIEVNRPQAGADGASRIRR